MQGKQWIQSNESETTYQLSQRVSDERVSIKRQSKRTTSVEQQPRRESNKRSNYKTTKSVKEGTPRLLVSYVSLSSCMEIFIFLE